MNRRIILIIMALTAMGQGAVALCLPSLPAIAIHLHTSFKLCKDLISIFFLGFGVSQLVYGPLSDRYGRRKVLLTGLVIFNLGALFAIFATSITQLLLMRLLQGLGAGATMVSSRAILRDTHKGLAFTKVTSYLSMSFAIGLGVMPLMGGYLQQAFQWPAIFVLLLVLGLVLIITVYCFLPETLAHKNQTLAIRAYCKETVKKYLCIIINTKFLSYLFGGVFAYGVVIAYSVMTPFLIQNNLHISASVYGWCTVVLAFFYYLGAYLNKHLVNRVGVKTMLKMGLSIIIVSGLVMIISSMLFALNFMALFIPLIFATIGQTFIFSNCIAGALHDFAKTAGTAAALFSGLQIMLAASISTLLSLIPEQSELPIGIVLIGLGISSLIALLAQIINRDDSV